MPVMFKLILKTYCVDSLMLSAFLELIVIPAMTIEVNKTIPRKHNPIREL